MEVRPRGIKGTIKAGGRNESSSLCGNWKIKLN